jgi:hypothetical protein
VIAVGLMRCPRRYFFELPAIVRFRSLCGAESARRRCES